MYKMRRVYSPLHEHDIYAQKKSVKIKNDTHLSKVTVTLLNIHNLQKIEFPKKHYFGN